MTIFPRQEEVIPISPTQPKKRKTAAEKREEAKVTEANPAPETGSTDPDASQDAQPTEGQSAPEAPSEAQPSEQQSSSEEWPNSANYQPKHRPLTAAGLDQQAAHDAREAEKAAQREEHNARTADSGQRGRKVG